MQATPEQILSLSGVQFHRSGDEWFFVKCHYHAGEGDDPLKWKGRINPENGVYKCHSCGHPTTVFQYVSTVLGKPVQAIKLAIDNVLQTKTGLSEEVVDVWQKALLADAETLKHLKTKHGITVDTAIKYKLGFNTKRVMIPVFEAGILANVRQYSYSATENKIMNMKGYGKNKLYPEPPKGQEVYITEGEFKALILRQYGFEALCNTAGAGSWDAVFTDHFVDKDVFIVYDLDAAGKKGALKLASILIDVAHTVRIVYLPLSGKPYDKDINDYFVKHNYTADDFDKLCENAALYCKPEIPKGLPDDPKVYDVDLHTASKCENYNKRVKFTAVVSAKDTAPYIIPKRARVICEANKDYCAYCHVVENRGHEFVVAEDTSNILAMAAQTAHAQKEVLKELSGVYPKCTSCTFEPLETINVEELRLIPQIKVGHKSGEMVVRRAFAVAHGTETNANYEFESRVCVDPATQAVTLVAYKLEKAGNDLDSYQLRHDLTRFQPAMWTKEGVECKLHDIYEDLESNVTKIYKRRDLHIFYDLAWHSVLYLPFQGKIARGWADVLCIGDSGQGKSECSSRLSDHYRCGERVDTKRASVAGLVGGLQEQSKRWFVQWGTIPLNDRRLVLLEECKGMAPENIGVLTDMRSSGVAEIQKIERAKTHARTRLIWISNPRSDRGITEYNYGVDAVRELIGNLEDIRRFDMVMAVGKGEVPNETINAPERTRKIVAHNYTSDLCSELVLWAWSRKENHIHYEPNFEDALLAAATRMGRKYSSTCPIVEPSDQRHKLLRLVAGLAARTYSTDNGEDLVLRVCHVEVVEAFLDRIYCSKALGYGDYSAAQMGESILRDEGEINKRLNNIPNAADTVATIIETDVINVQVICDCTEWQKDLAADLIGFLVRKQALKGLRRGGYRKTSAFIELLKNFKVGPREERPF